MSLAPYGDPRYADKIGNQFIDLKTDGSYHLNMKCFGYVDSLCVTGSSFCEPFGWLLREAGSRIGRREIGLAASSQLVAEEAVTGLARHLRNISGRKTDENLSSHYITP